ncbi:MAG: hypothetical protein MJ137_06585 [Clostridia bacterium]|nr:hypothetical protein [Clostridia bacterium]
MKRALSLILVVIICLASFAACGEKTPAGAATPPAAGTPAPPAEVTTAAPNETTATPSDVTTTPAVTTEAEVTTSDEPVYDFGENEYGKLDDAEKTKLMDVIPALLPDGTPIMNWARPYCMDDILDKEGYGVHYYFDGKSSPYAEYVGTDNGGIFGTGIKMEAHGQTPGGDRAELELHSYYEANLKGAKGIMFYVDFSTTTPQPADNNKPLCASVTINVNTYRCNKDSNGSVGFYFADGVWSETKNINACRMELPNGFKGWVYIPATSYQKTSDKTPIADENGLFIDIPVENMRLYTDGYTYSTDGSAYVIFDEILFIY